MSLVEITLNMKFHKSFPSRLTIAAVGTSTLLLSVLLPPSILSLMLAATFSGLAPMATSNRRWSPVGFLSASLMLSLPIWAVSSVFAWSIGIGDYLGFLPVMLSAVSLIVCFFRRKVALKLTGFTYADAFALSVTLVVAIPMLVVWQTNGPKTVENQKVFDAGLGGFTDGFYHLGLVELAKNRKSYPTENPVFAGVPNRYPSLLHCGLAGLSTRRSGPAAVTLWPILPILMLAPVALGFLAVHRLSRARKLRGILIIGVGYTAFVFIRIDHFIFPQIQAIAFGLLALLLYYTPRFPSNNWSQWIKYTALALILVASHTVSATVAIVIAMCLVGFLVIRKKRIRILPGAISVAMLVSAFVVLNNYPHQPTLKDTIPPNLIKDALRIIVLPYIFPLILALVLVIRHKPFGPLSAASFGLIMLSVCYASFGFTAATGNEIFFSVFNSPRFAVFGLLLMVPLINLKTRIDISIAGILLAYTILLPNGPVETIPSMISSEPRRYPMSDVRMIHRAFKSAPDKSILTYKTDFGPPAFSGSPLYISEASYMGYALHTVDERVARQRLADSEAFFATMTPAARVDYMKTNGIGAVILQLTPGSGTSGFLPHETVTVQHGQQWTIFKLKS